jgi:2-keto-4-pentenoate hydratase/2-oxohepta-3-ene-1,7-dioic acid hydratase in catechol pathway
MRFATIDSGTGPRAAVVTGPADDPKFHPFPAGITVMDLVRAGLESALEQGSRVTETQSLGLAEVRLLPPVEAPTVRDFVAFEEHVEGVVKSIDGKGGVTPEWYDAPTFYFTNPYALVGAFDEVEGPAGTHALDFELELAAVIGVEGRNITPEQGREHIFGYTIMNDFSARDVQRREMKVNLGPAKGKDFASTLGPWLVTADEFEAHHDKDGFLSLEMAVWVNGVEIGRDLSSNMGWPFGHLVAYAARDSWVRPGDVLGSGTCGNGGCLAELWGRRGEQDPPPLQPGDVVTMTIEGIGTISNRIVAAGPVLPLAPASPRPRLRRHQGA